MARFKFSVSASVLRVVLVSLWRGVWGRLGYWGAQGFSWKSGFADYWTNCFFSFLVAYS
jgi:hypothetical protein